MVNGNGNCQPTFAPPCIVVSQTTSGADPGGAGVWLSLFGEKAKFSDSFSILDSLVILQS